MRMTEQERAVLLEAAQALIEHEQLRAAMRDSERRLRTLCRAFDAASGCTGFQTYHLRNACETRGLLDAR